MTPPLSPPFLLSALPLNLSTIYQTMSRLITAQQLSSLMTLISLIISRLKKNVSCFGDKLHNFRTQSCPPCKTRMCSFTSSIAVMTRLQVIPISKPAGGVDGYARPFNAESFPNGLLYNSKRKVQVYVNRWPADRRRFVNHTQRHRKWKMFCWISN
jgi:hypothetical protein